MLRRSSLALAVTLALLFATAATAGGPHPPVVQPDPGADVPAGDPLDLAGASLAQSGDGLTVTITTTRPFDPARLAAHKGRSLCTFLEGEQRHDRLCLHGPQAGVPARVRLARLAQDGTVQGDHLVAALVTRPDDRSIAISVRLSALGLAPGRLRWRVTAAWRGGGVCRTAGSCVDSAPDQGTYVMHLHTPLLDGCLATGPTYQRFGPPRKEVALTFDDGPDQSTPALLDALEKAHAPATFFVVGRHVAGHEDLLRRELADGDIIGDHTFNHADLTKNPGAAPAEIGNTATAIRNATRGYRSCLFRAPYGAVDNPLFALVRNMGMTTIGWDVDPRDWSTPGTDAIVSRVLGTVTPGAIVIMHDGGGPRGQTVAAVPRIITALRHRGYKLVTVPELLGYIPTYR